MNLKLTLQSPVLTAHVHPGDCDTLEVNQATRDATVLAVLPTEYLVEYEMPAGTSALRVINLAGPDRSVSYKGLPKKWLLAMRDASDQLGRGYFWIGTPQQAGRRGSINFYAVCLARGGALANWVHRTLDARALAAAREEMYVLFPNSR